MGTWLSCTYERQPLGIEGEAVYEEPPQPLLDAALMACQFRLLFPVPNFPDGMYVIDLDVRTDRDHVDVTVFGSASSAYLVKEVRIMTLRFRDYP